MSQEGAGKKDHGSSFYISLGLFIGIFGVWLVHLAKTYDATRSGAITVIMIMVSVVVLLTAGTIMIASYTLKSFNREALLIGLYVGAMALFVLLIAIGVGLMT